jgi:hypothetical protein
MPQTPEERVYTRLEDIDWEQWVPQQRATLLFVMRGSEGDPAGRPPDITLPMQHR